MGLIGGSIFAGISGFRNAPKGLTNGFRYAGREIATRGPVFGGAFAAWGRVFRVTLFLF